MNRLKEYFKNSPRRIGWTWFAVHLFFLLVALFWFEDFDILYLFSYLTVSGVFIYFFPILPITMIFSSMFDSLISNSIVILLAPTYYILFFVMLFKAKNTSAKSFKIISIIFAIWFFIALFFSFWALSDFISPDVVLQ